MSLKWKKTKESQEEWALRIWGTDKQSINTVLHFKKYHWTTFHSEKRLLLLEWRIKPWRCLYFDTTSCTLRFHFCPFLFWVTPYSIGYSTLSPGLSTQQIPYFLFHGDNWSSKEYFFIKFSILTGLSMAWSYLLIIVFQYEHGLGNWPLDLLFSSIKADMCFSYVLILCRAQRVADTNNCYSNI